MDNSGTNIKNEDQEHSSLEQKLFLIDQELRTLHQFCIGQGYTPHQIYQFAEPFYEQSKKKQRKQVVSAFKNLLIIAAVVVGLVYYDPAFRLICMYGRRASIQLLPYWDWTSLYNEDCFIENPYYVGTELTDDDCELCEVLEKIERIHDVDHLTMAEEYLKRDIPVIVTDGMQDWQAKEKFNLHFLNQLYENEDALKEEAPCMFTSNVRMKYASARVILRKGVAGEISGWYAHWENCEKRAAKVLRQFYKRPYFLPPMVEMGEPNWIFIARDYKAKRPKLADVAMPMILYAQVSGEAKIELTPRAPCNTTCSKLYATIHEGEILVLTDLMWTLHYSQLGNPETVAIAAGGYFD